MLAERSRGTGLQIGMTEELQNRGWPSCCAAPGAEQVRFTTSGSLATMYALLARAYTGRDLVLKVGGGWHGAQPWGLKGVYISEAPAAGEPESAGLPGALADEIVVTRFNELDALEDDFRQYGERIACFIVEPFPGGAASSPAGRSTCAPPASWTHRSARC